MMQLPPHSYLCLKLSRKTAIHQHGEERSCCRLGPTLASKAWIEIAIAILIVAGSVARSSRLNAALVEFPLKRKLLQCFSLCHQVDDDSDRDRSGLSCRDAPRPPFDYQNHPFCRLLITSSTWVFIIGTYKNDGFSSQWS